LNVIFYGHREHLQSSLTESDAVIILKVWIMSIYKRLSLRRRWVFQCCENLAFAFYTF